MTNKPDDRAWGVVQELVIEADTPTALRAGCTIAFTYNTKGVESYAVENGSLVLFWSDTTGIKLPFCLNSVDAVFEFVSRWLSQAQYGRETDTDGSVKKGYRIEIDHGYVFMRIKPTWIVYGK